METKELIGLIIAFVAVTGGLGIGALAIYVSLNKEKEEMLAKLEAQSKQRLALIEKGLDPTMFDKKPSGESIHHALLWGLLLGGVGFGGFMGYVVAESNHWRVAIVVNAFALASGGIGLIIYYILTSIFSRRKTA